MILSYRFCPRNGFGWKELIFKEKTFLNESRTSKIKSKWGGGKSLWILGDLKKFWLSTFVGAIWNSDHQRPERSLPLPMKYKMSESSPEEKARWANHLETKTQYDHILSWPKMQNTKSTPDEKGRLANHLNTKRKISRYPENIFTLIMYFSELRIDLKRLALVVHVNVVDKGSSRRKCSWTIIWEWFSEEKSRKKLWRRRRKEKEPWEWLPE